MAVINSFFMFWLDFWVDNFYELSSNSSSWFLMFLYWALENVYENIVKLWFEVCYRDLEFLLYVFWGCWGKSSYGYEFWF